MKPPSYAFMAEYLLLERTYIALGFKSDIDIGFETRTVWGEEQPPGFGKVAILEETDASDWYEQKRVLEQRWPGQLKFRDVPPATRFYQATKSFAGERFQ